MRTVAWGIQGLGLLSAGFLLLLVCVLKLFVWDLRNLDMPFRVLSFIVLGLILIGVSFFYSRFRERITGTCEHGRLAQAAVLRPVHLAVRVLRRPEPLFYGIAVTDRCNLTCRGCRVANTGRPDMTWERLVAVMRDAWQRGFRELYFPAASRCSGGRRAHAGGRRRRSQTDRLLPCACLHQRDSWARIFGGSNVGQHGRPAGHLREAPRTAFRTSGTSHPRG